MGAGEQGEEEQMTDAERIAPLIDLLQRFCHAHRSDDPTAGEAMIEPLRSLWPDIPHRRLDPPDQGHHATEDADSVALEIVVDVGDVARLLLTEGQPANRLAWCRANLIDDLERYAEARRQPPQPAKSGL